MTHQQNRQQYNPKLTVVVALTVWNLITRHTKLRRTLGNEFAQFSMDDERWLDLSALILTPEDYQQAMAEVEAAIPPGTDAPSEGRKQYLAFERLIEKGKILRRRPPTDGDQREVVFTKPWLDLLEKATKANDPTVLSRFNSEGLVIETVSQPNRPTFHRVIGLGFDRNQRQIQGRIELIRDKRLILSARTQNRILLARGEDTKTESPYHIVLARHGDWLQCAKGEAIKIGRDGVELTEQLPEVFYAVADTGMYQEIGERELAGKKKVILVGRGPASLTLDLVGGGKVVISKKGIKVEGVANLDADDDSDEAENEVEAGTPEGEEAVEPIVGKGGIIAEPIANPSTEPPQGTGDQDGEEGKDSANGAHAGTNGTGNDSDNAGNPDTAAKPEKAKKPRTRKVKGTETVDPAAA